MTPQITQPEVMTDGQRKQIKRFLEDGLTTTDLDALGLSKEEAQEIIEKGNLVQTEMQQLIIALLKKNAIIDQRFGAALTEFDLTVPMDYVHTTYINQAKKEVKKLKTTYYYNDDLNSKNFANATTTLVPGKTYKVKIYPILSTVSSVDCMNFLKRQRAILVGGQGVILVQSMHKEHFPEGKWTVSFDEKENLWKDADGRHWVPYVCRYSDGDWEFCLGNFGHDWGADDCLLCFCDK